MPRAKVTKELLLRIGRYYKPYWKQIALTLIAVAVGQALSLVPTMMTKNIIDVAPQRNLALGPVCPVIVRSDFCARFDGCRGELS